MLGQQVTHLGQGPGRPPGLQHRRHRLRHLRAGALTEVAQPGRGPIPAGAGHPHPAGHRIAGPVARRHRDVEGAAGALFVGLDRGGRGHPQSKRSVGGLVVHPVGAAVPRKRPAVGLFRGEIVGHLRVVAPLIAVLGGDEVGGPPVAAGAGGPRVLAGRHRHRFDIAFLAQPVQAPRQGIAVERVAAGCVGQRDHRLGVRHGGELATGGHAGPDTELVAAHAHPMRGNRGDLSADHDARPAGATRP